MTIDAVCPDLNRSKMPAAWLARLDPSQWASQPGWVSVDGIRLPPPLSAISRLEIALSEHSGHWLSVAREPDSGTWCQFDILSFIALWNDNARATLDAQIDLLVDVTAPYVLRHPGLLPMEVSFDQSDNLFKRSIIYCVSDLGSFPEEPV